MQRAAAATTSTNYAARARAGRRLLAEGAARGTPRRPARAYRPLPTVLLSVSKSGKPAEGLERDFVARLRRYAPFTEVRVRTARKARDAEAACADEGQRVAAELDKLQYFNILLCERGERLTSEQLADALAGAGDRGERGVAVVLGGPFGHGAAAEQRAHLKLRLSDLVLNHQVAKLVSVEALYRSHTILRGEPYHH